MPEVSVCLAAAIFEKVTSLSFELCRSVALSNSDKEDLSRLKVTFEYGTSLSLSNSLTYYQKHVSAITASMVQ